MVRTVLAWFARAGRLPRGLVAALALACHVAAGAAVPMRDAADGQARFAASVAVFCQSGAHPAKQDGAPVHRQAPDPALCAALSAHGHAAAVLGDGVFAFLPAWHTVGRVGPAGARAPPARVFAAFLARGPPLG